MNKAYISLGSNMGNSINIILKAIDCINRSNHSKVIKQSSLYKTKPVGYMMQDDFINAVIMIQTSLGPYELLEFLQKLELEFKRERIIRFGPRTLDLDILLFNDLILNDKILTIPHERMFKRAFVLIPLAQIEPNMYFNAISANIENLIKNLSDDDIAGVELIEHE